MAKLIKEIIVGRKKFKQYDFKKENLIAGSCPECLHPVTFHEQHDLYKCTNKECYFMANKNGVMVYSTEMRKKGKKEFLEVPTLEENN